MKSSAVVLALAAVLLCAATASARVDWGDTFGDLGFVKGHKTAAIKTAHDVNRGKGGEEEYTDRRTFVATKYYVPPSMHSEFMDEWRTLESDTTREKGNIVYALWKTLDDNLHFMIYGEWETMDDWMMHYHSDHVYTWKKFLEDTDITYELMPLKNVTSIKEETRGKRTSGGGNADEAGKGRGRGKTARVLFQYHMDPSVKNEFIDAWEDHAKDVWREDGNSVFALRKVGTNNHHFYAFGKWDSYDDFMDHINSKHTRRMKDFFEKYDVHFFMDPMYRVGDEKRGEM